MNIENGNHIPSSPPDAVPLREVALRLHPQDNVVIAKIDLQVVTILALETDSDSPAHVPLCQPVPGGHKVALREIAAGEPVRRYGQVIGLATRAILPGGGTAVGALRGTTGFSRVVLDAPVLSTGIIEVPSIWGSPNFLTPWRICAEWRDGYTRERKAPALSRRTEAMFRTVMRPGGRYSSIGLARRQIEGVFLCSYATLPLSAG